MTPPGNQKARDRLDALPCDDEKRLFHRSSKGDVTVRGGASTGTMVPESQATANGGSGTLWHAWKVLEEALNIAKDFLVEVFAVHGAERWRERPLDRRRASALRDLPRVADELRGIEAANQDEHALADAIEAAVKASALAALQSPHSGAALEFLGFTTTSRGKGKTEREELAAALLGKSGRWFRKPSRDYDDLEPRMCLLVRIAESLSAGARPFDAAKVWPSFPYERVRDQMRAAREEIRILVTWVPDIGPVLSGIAGAVGNGASVKIMIQEPRCPGLLQRLTTLGIKSPEYGYLHAVKLFDDLRNVISASEPGKFAVRTYLDPPLGQLYATEENLWFGVFWPDSYSLQGPQVEVSTRDSHLGRRSSGYFEQLWSSATPLVAEDL